MKELKSLHDQARDLKRKLVESYRKQEEDKKTVTSLSLKVTDLVGCLNNVVVSNSFNLYRDSSQESKNLDLTLSRDQSKTKNQQLQSSLAESEGKLAQALQVLCFK